MKITTLPYWGQISAIISQGTTSLFLTHLKDAHDPTLYRLDSSSDHPTLTVTALPVVMDSLCAMRDGTVILMGQDGHFYQSDWQAKKIAKLSETSIFASFTAIENETATQKPALAITEFGDTIAVLYPHQLTVWHYQKHQLGDNLANLTFDTNTTTLSVSSDGEWLVVGDSQGTVTSFHFNAEKTLLLQSSSETLHQGAVTALAFEPIAQQFFSAGEDKQLLRTHAQGKLQGIDRGKASQHSEMIRAMAVSTHRLYTGSDDKSVKAWQFDKGQATTCKDDLVKIRHLTISHYLGQDSVLAVGTDQSLRFIPVDSEGKLGTVAHIIKDGYQRLTDLLGGDEASFKEGLTLLKNQVDNNSLNVVSKVLEKTTDGKRSEQLATWLASTNLAKTTHQLEQLMTKHANENVRHIAFSALQQRSQINPAQNTTPDTVPNATGVNPLHYLQLALDSKFEDINRLAIAEYIKVATSEPTLQPQILPILQHTLNHGLPMVARQALSGLETLLPSDSPKADLLALASSKSDIQQAGLIRLYQRKLLDNFEVKRQLVLLQTSEDMVVRQTAFYVSVLSQPKLAKVLAERDPNFTRTLQDFNEFRLILTAKDVQNNNSTLTASPDISLDLTVENLSQTNPTAIQASNKTKADSDSLQAVGDSTKKLIAIPKLDSQAVEPLLQGLSNPHSDISFRASYALALLRDERAFGVLVRLMNDPDDTIKIGVAKALGELGQADALKLLPVLLNESKESVRQVAMQAYGKLSPSTLDWVKAGFASNKSDIRQQALAILLKYSHENPTDSEILPILTRAVNDSSAPIRQEVIKVLVNRLSQYAVPSDFNLLALIRKSEYEDVHQVVLDNWQSVVRQSPTNTPLSDKLVAMLSDLFASRFPNIREQAFNLALQEHKRISLKTVLSLGFASPIVFSRQKALEILQEKKSPELMPLITPLFADEERELRLKALQVALGFGDKNVLNTALTSPYSDIQLAGAKALAQYGDSDSHAQSLAIFEHFLQLPMPELPEAKKAWQDNIQQALLGLTDLAEPQGFAWFDKFLSDPNVEFGKSSLIPSQLLWVARPENFDRLVELQQDERKPVSEGASLALAVWGDARGEYAFYKPMDSLDDYQRLLAQVGLGVLNTQDTAMFRGDLSNYKTAMTTQMILAFYDLLLNPQQPRRLLQMLSFARDYIVLMGAGVIARYPTPEQAWQYLTEHFNRTLQQHRVTYLNQQNKVDKTEKPWAVDVATIKALAQCVVYGSPLVRANAVLLLLKANNKTTFEAWQTDWQRFYQHHLDVIVPHLPQPPNSDPTFIKHCQAVAFGAYLGVIRQADLPEITQAMHALVDFAKQYPDWQDSVQRTFVPLLNHKNLPVRELAWQSLHDFGMPADKLGEQAMSSPYLDSVQKGLALWLTTHSEQDADRQLQQLLQTNSPVLTQEAYRLLVKRVGSVTADKLALTAYYLPLRRQVMDEWQQVTNLERQADKRELLLTATHNDDWQTRLKGFELLLKQGAKKDSFGNLNTTLDAGEFEAYIDGLLGLWQYADDMNQQRHVLNLLATYGNADTAEKLIALLDSPQRKIDTAQIYQVIGDSRSVRCVPALLERFHYKNEERAEIVKALTKISGFDQPIQDYHEEFNPAHADKRWLDRQHPRHVAVLLQLANLLLQHTDYIRFNNLLDSLAWAGFGTNDEKTNAQENTQVDKLLQKAYNQLPSHHTANIVKAMAYRADKRNGDVTSLRKALSHREPLVQFLGAEGLAKRGLKDGFSVLMATIDYNTDGELRRRAVLALGELAEEQAYDKLIKLASDPEHYLQDVASEALGHMGQTEHGQRIFALLSTKLQQSIADDNGDNPAIVHWVNGLRWLNTPASWQQIRDYITATTQAEAYIDEPQLHAIKVLQYHPQADSIGEANRELLLKLIRTSDDEEVIETSYATAQSLFGNASDTVYPYDWAILASYVPTLSDNLSLERVSQHASLPELLDFISDYGNQTQHWQQSSYDEDYLSDNETIRQALYQAVLSREDMPPQALHSLLNNDNLASQQLGLRYLTQHPQRYWQAEIESQLGQQLRHATAQWQTLLAQVANQPTYQPWKNQTQNFNNLTLTLQQLIWLLFRFADLSKNQALIAETLTWLVSQQTVTSVQAISELNQTVNNWLKQALLGLLARPTDSETTVTGDWLTVLQQPYWATSELQQLVASILAKYHAMPTAEPTAKGKGKKSLLQSVKNLFGQTSTNDNATAVTSELLLNWVKQHNFHALYQVASDSQHAESLRISAIEGLGLLTDNEVGELLMTLQKNDPDSDIQRASFSALRRYQRNQQRQAKLPKYSTSNLNEV